MENRLLLKFYISMKRHFTDTRPGPKLIGKFTPVLGTDPISLSRLQPDHQHSQTIKRIVKTLHI